MELFGQQTIFFKPMQFHFFQDKIFAGFFFLGIESFFPPKRATSGASPGKRSCRRDEAAKLEFEFEMKLELLATI